MTSGPPRQKLGVLVDGVALPDAEAHAIWDRFSMWMEEHRGDLRGFAEREGFLSVHPGVDGDRPVLRISQTVIQQPYGPVRDRGDHKGGSPVRHAGSRPRG